MIFSNIYDVISSTRVSKLETYCVMHPKDCKIVGTFRSLYKESISSWAHTEKQKGIINCQC